MRERVISWAGAWLVLLSAAALAQTEGSASDAPPVPARVRLVLRGLVEREGRLVSADARAVVLEDDLGRRRETPISDTLALVRLEPEGAGPLRTLRLRLVPEGAGRESGVLTLVDGQRFAGRPGRAPDHQTDILVWRHSGLGTLSIPAERVAGFSMPGFAPIDQFLGAQAPAQDLVVLTNGDRLEGFFEWVGVTARVESAGGPVPVDPALLERVVFANPREASAGGRACLSDGTVVATAGASFTESGRLSLELASGKTLALRWEELRGLVTEASRVVALSSLDVAAQRAIEGEERFHTPPIAARHPKPPPAGGAPSGPPALGAMDLVLDGPMEVEWALPARAKRIAGRVALAPEALAWGDCEVVIEAGAGEPWRVRLNSARPTEPFNLEASGAVLRVRIESGERGPIDDRVLLQSVLIETVE
ncbi:MAG TPA: hypothetical protein DEB06_05305 [Phycisphaerales bacterium]|nr:hypothetical protein [Phycisphaerales bacterium]